MTRNKYTVKQLADLSGITVRTLHHYDKIGLLKPALRSEKRYRYYDKESLLRLQQILFYRELGFSLEQTGGILDDPEFNYLEALVQHRKALIAKQERTEKLIATLDRTLTKIKGDQKMTITDKDLYEGFDQEKIDRWNREVDEKYDPEKVAESKRNLKRMSKDQFQNIKLRGGQITQSIADNMEKNFQSHEIQALIKEHHAWIENFYSCSAEMYKGLSQLYIQNPEFTEFYENVKPGLAVYISKAMTYYADHSL